MTFNLKIQNYKICNLLDIINTTNCEDNSMYFPTVKKSIFSSYFNLIKYFFYI